MRSTLRVLLGLIALTLAAGLFTGWASAGALDAAVNWLRSPSGRIALPAGGALLALIPLAQVLSWWRVHRRAREISYTTEGGRVAVSLLAVEEALTRAVEGEACVKKAAVRVYEDRVKRQVIIDAVMTLWEVANVTERNRTCSQILRRRFNELMPEQTAVQVNLTVHRLTPRREEPAAKPASATPPEPQPKPVERGATDDGEALAQVGDYPAPDLGGARSADEPPTPPETLAEDDLYVGPSYPVESDEDDGAADYLGRPIPVKKKR